MLYALAKNILKIYYKIVYFASAEGVDNIPKEGGVIICANHRHFNDPLITAAFMRRHTKFLAKAEVFKPGFFGWFLKKCGCVPLDRDHGDIKALRTCIRILKDENVLILYPEGTRFCEHIADVKPGAIMFAIKSHVPIVPVGISRLRPFRKAKVRFGKPVYYNEYYDKKVSGDEYKKLVNSLMLQIFDLVDEKCSYYNEIKASVENEH